jgi:periplasmic copper chaperone A
MRMTLLGSAAMACLLGSPAEAHVGLTPAEAEKGVTVVLGFGIGHGCEGQPTTAVRLQIPAGVIAVQPFAKPGWTIEIVNGAYAGPQARDGAQVTEGVIQINWTGGNLPSELYDQFFIRARIADNVETGTMVWFPVVQECPNGVSRWITVPVEGQPEPAEPTPGLMVGEPAAAGHAH